MAKATVLKIGVDTKEFNKEMAKSTSLGKELASSLDIKFDSKRAVQAQDAFQKAIIASEEKAKVLNRALEDLKNNGGVDTEDYKKLELELAKNESKAIKLQNELTKIDNIKTKNVQSEFEQLSQKADKVAKATKMLSLAAAGLVTGILGIGYSAVKSGAEIDELAQQMGISAEAAQQFDYIAKQLNVNTDQMIKGFIKARAALAELATGGTSKASEALSKLGIDFANFETSDEQFYAIIKSLSEMTDETEMLALANEIFGEKLANELLPAIKAGGSALDDYAAEYAKLGGLTNEQVAALAKQDEQFKRIQASITNLKNAIGAALLPIISTLSDVLENRIIPVLKSFSGWLEGLSDGQKKFAIGALALIAAIAPMAFIISKLSGGVGLVTNAISGLNGAFTFLAANPIVAVLAAVAGLMVYLFATNEEFRKSIMRLVGILSSSFVPVLQLVATALKPIASIASLLLAGLIPLVNVALKPLLIILEALAPLFQLIAFVLKPLTILADGLSLAFRAMGDAITAAFSAVPNFIEGVINFAIKGINALIKAINLIPGISIPLVPNVDFGQIGGGGTIGGGDNGGLPPDVEAITNMPAIGGDYIDNSTKEINLGGITIDTRGRDVDVDYLMREINKKLAVGF